MLVGKITNLGAALGATENFSSLGFLQFIAEVRMSAQ